MVGVSDLTTAGTLRRAQIAVRLGATAVMALPISYWRLTEDELRQHFTTLAESIGIPVMVYNNPATTGIDMSPEFLFELVSEVDNITMVKESSGDITRMQRLNELSGNTLLFFNGSNPLALNAFQTGATGWCTAAPCLVPDHVVAFYREITAGRTDAAADIFDRLRPFLEMIVSRPAHHDQVRSAQHRNRSRRSAPTPVAARRPRSHRVETTHRRLPLSTAARLPGTFALSLDSYRHEGQCRLTGCRSAADIRPGPRRQPAPTGYQAGGGWCVRSSTRAQGQRRIATHAAKHRRH